MDRFLKTTSTSTSGDSIRTLLLNCFAYINKDTYSKSERKFFKGFHPVILDKINQFIKNTFIERAREEFRNTFNIQTPISAETNKQEMLKLFIQQIGCASNLIYKDLVITLSDCFTVEDYKKMLDNQTTSDKIRIQFEGYTNPSQIQFVLEAVNQTTNRNIREIKLQETTLSKELLNILVTWKNKDFIKINLEWCGLTEQSFSVLTQATENKRFLIGGNHSDLIKELKKLKGKDIEKFQFKTENQIYAIKN
jgi:hypothetical protein